MTRNYFVGIGDCRHSQKGSGSGWTGLLSPFSQVARGSRTVGPHEGPGQRNQTEEEGEKEEKVKFRTSVGLLFGELIVW